MNEWMNEWTNEWMNEWMTELHDYLLRYCSSQTQALRSRWLVGSSSNIIDGRMYSARASAIRMRQPPEKFLHLSDIIAAVKPSPSSISAALTSAVLTSSSSRRSYTSNNRSWASIDNTLHIKVKVKAVDLYSASSCTPKAGGQATSNALSSLTWVPGHTGHCPQPAHTGLGSDPTVGQTAPVSSRSPPS